MTQPTTTRRDLLRLGTSAAAYAAGAAIVTGGVALASQAKGATRGVSPELLRLIGQHKAADDTINRFYREVFNPAVDRHHAMIAAIPHVKHEAAPLVAGHQPLHWTTEKRSLIAHAKGIAHIPQKHSSQTEGGQNRRREARSFYAAALRRERAVARTGVISGADAAGLREDELWVPIRAAKLAVYNFPVASVADLAAKLTFIEDTDGMDGEDLLPLVMDDVARLSGGEA